MRVNQSIYARRCALLKKKLIAVFCFLFPLAYDRFHLFPNSLSLSIKIFFFFYYLIFLLIDISISYYYSCIWLTDMEYSSDVSLPLSNLINVGQTAFETRIALLGFQNNSTSSRKLCHSKHLKKKTKVSLRTSVATQLGVKYILLVRG